MSRRCRGATYHGAALIVVTAAGRRRAPQPEEATVLELPDADGGAFAELVGRYAALLDSGRGAAEAWHDAVVRDRLAERARRDRHRCEPLVVYGDVEPARTTSAPSIR